MRKYTTLLLILGILHIVGCKKDKKPSPQQNQNNSPTTNLNGWSYHGNSEIKVSSANNKYQLYLCKVHQHSGEVLDVFYGTRYMIPNTPGLITTSSTRWLLKSDGSTIRTSDDLLNEFSSTSGRLFQGSNGEENIPPIHVEVLGSGVGEFKVTNPFQITNNLNAPSGGSLIGWENWSGSDLPVSITTTLVCHLIQPNIKVDVSDIYWFGYTLAVGKNPTTDQYFVLTYHRDSSFIMLNAVSPQNLSTNYGTMRKIQPLMGKKLREIIPDWTTNPVDMDIWPLYYQYSSEPHSIYFLVQNQTKIYVLKINLNNFQFSLVHQYTQPRNSNNGGINEIFGIQFIDKEPGTFLFYERRQSGIYALLHKNGTTQQITMPQFNSEVVPSIASLRFDNNKYWLIVASKDKKVHLFSRNY